jgi:hypothetical protein
MVDAPKLTPARRRALAVGLWAADVQSGRFAESNRTSEPVDLDRQGVRARPTVYWQSLNWLTGQDPPLAVVVGHTGVNRECRLTNAGMRLARASAGPWEVVT